MQSELDPPVPGESADRLSVELGERGLARAREMEGPEALRALGLAAEHLVRGGDLERGVATLCELVDQAGIGLSRYKWLRLLRVAFGRGAARRRARRIIARMRETERWWASASGPTVIARTDAAATAVLLLGMIETVPAAEVQTAHLRLAVATGDRYRILRALAIEVAFEATASRDHTWAIDMAGTVVQEAERSEDPRLRVLAYGAEGLIAIHEGRWQEGLASMERTIDLAREHGLEWTIEGITAHQFKLVCLHYLGDFAELVRHTGQLRPAIADRGDEFATAALATGIPNGAWLAVDDLDRASQESEAAIRSFLGRPAAEQHRWHVYSTASRMLVAGDGDGLARLLEDQREMLAPSFMPSVRYAYDHLVARAGLVAAVAGHVEHLRTANRAAAHLRRSGMEWSEALGLLCTAALSAYERRSGVATLLKTSIERLEHLHMTAFAAAARFRLARLEGEDPTSALEMLRGRGIHAPERFVDLLVPWPRGLR